MFIHDKIINYSILQNQKRISFHLNKIIINKVFLKIIQKILLFL